MTSPSRPQLSIYSDNWHDLSACRETIKDRGYKVSSIVSTPAILSKFDENEYDNKVYVAIGIERPFTVDEVDVLWTFLRKGGNIIIADDFGRGNSFWVDAENYGFADINIRFKDKQLYDPNYIKNTKFVTVNATLFKNYELILNQPAALDVSDSNFITTFAESSRDSWLDENKNGVRDPRELKGKNPVIVGFSKSDVMGSAVIISDPGLFINDNWHQLDNSEFVLDLIGSLIPNGGEVIFDESRHITPELLENSRRVIYSGIVYFTSTIWSIIFIGALIISFTLFIGVKLKPQRLWRNSNLLDRKYFNVLNNPYVGPHDFWQVYNTFLEKVRLGYNFGPDEFKELDEETLERLIDDQYLWEFITQQFSTYVSYVDHQYYRFIVERIIHWSPWSPESIQTPEYTGEPYHHESLDAIEVSPLEEQSDKSNNFSNGGYDRVD
jgi:hypothetical protein